MRCGAGAGVHADSSSRGPHADRHRVLNLQDMGDVRAKPADCILYLLYRAGQSSHIVHRMLIQCMRTVHTGLHCHPSSPQCPAGVSYEGALVAHAALLLVRRSRR